MLNDHPGASHHPSWPGGAVAQLPCQSSILSPSLRAVLAPYFKLAD